VTAKSYNTKDDIIYLFEHRAAIVQYGCGVSRETAEEMAMVMIRDELGDRCADIIKSWFREQLIFDEQENK